MQQDVNKNIMFLKKVKPEIQGLSEQRLIGYPGLWCSKSLFAIRL